MMLPPVPSVAATDLTTTDLERTRARSVLVRVAGNLRQFWQGYWLSPPGC